MMPFKVLFATIVLLSSVSVLAQAVVTPEQLEQFKRLPPLQQELLAREYGFDVSLLRQSGVSKSPMKTIDTGDAQIIERDALVEEVKQKAKPFGHNLFSGTPTSFQQADYVPVPGDYRIGPGDSVVINLFGKESEQYEITIDREGQFLLPKLRPFSVTGLTFNELKQLVQQEVAQRMVGMQAAVSMGKLRSIQIYVAGEAF